MKIRTSKSNRLDFLFEQEPFVARIPHLLIEGGDLCVLRFNEQIALSAAFISQSVLAWSEHGLLTREALSGLKQVQALEATYEPLETVLPRMGFKTPAELNLYLQIKRDSATRHGFAFEPRLQEKTGAAVKAIDIISHYSDEPDGWKDHHEGDEPDTFLFEEGQYPELWRPEYAMLGGKEGTPSQAFRHMWWGPLSLLHPIASFKLPFDMLKKPMGVADQRILIFIELARAAKKAGSLYWQLRFLANGLHFIQDCTQPFHVTQTASKKLILMATPAGGWKGATYKLDNITKRTTQLVAYYHWSYEDLIGRIFKNPSKYPSAYKSFSEALRKPTPLRKITSPDAYLQEVAKKSIGRSPVAGRTAIKFFPKIPKDVDLSTFDPSAFMNEAWWSEVETSSEENTRVRSKYFKSVSESFELFGESVRNVVNSEL